MGPGTRLPSLGQIPYTELRDGYQLQVEGLLAGGVDVLLIETVYDLLQAKAAINGARAAMRAAGVLLPLMVQVTVETTGRMLVGSEIGAALTALEAMQPDVIGMNCATGPAEMTEHLRYLAQHARTYLSALPNAGLPSVVDGHTHYDLTPDALAEAHERFVDEFGLNIVGGCCGTTPEHLRQVVEQLGAEPRAGRAHARARARLLVDLLARSVPPGARVPRGRRAHQRQRLAEVPRRDARSRLRHVRRDGTRAGEGRRARARRVRRLRRPRRHPRHGRDRRAASRPRRQLPLVFDSTEPQVVEAGLRHHGGKAILNSANLEEGDGEGKRMDRVFRLAREYGAAVICLTIDEEGQARTADWKLRVAKRIYDIAIERYGLEPTDLIFDALTFPLSTGDDDLRRDAMETIEAIRRIKTELPGASTILGLSNVSFGLKPARATCSTACSCTSAARPASTPRSCTRRASCRSTASTNASARSRST